MTGGEPRRRSVGLAGRLFAAQTLIAIVGALTLWLVASAVGPSIFHTHLHEAAGQVSADTSKHVEEAYNSASAISITVALFASLAAALAVSAYVSRRIAGPVGRLAVAARRVASGRYDTRVGAPGLGAEFSTLTTSFNAMADQLQTVESTRRRLLGDLAHEMRTPVATLDAYLEGMQDGVVTFDPATVAMLRTQTGRLTRLAEDISAVSRAEEHQLDLHLQPVAPADLVATAVGAFGDRYTEQDVALAADVEPDLPRLSADPERVGQVFTNLLDNALRHTPAGGRVTVTAAVSDDGRAVEFVVSDTGTGIPAEHLPHIFERFYRVDRARDRAHGGSGIGLAIVKALVEAHGGTVTATSAGQGHGAVFTVTLPAAPSTAA